MENKSGDFYSASKKTVDKGWPHVIKSKDVALQNAKRNAPVWQRRRRYNDYSMNRTRPRCLHRKAKEQLTENRNAVSEELSNWIIHRDVSFQVSSKFLKYEKQTNLPVAMLGKEMKNLQLELQEYQINAVQGNFHPLDAFQNVVARKYEINTAKMWKWTNCWETSYVYSGLQQRTRTKQWIRTMHKR